MTLSEELQWRGFVSHSTLADLKVLDKGPRTFYHGFDASAPSQTVGNLAALMFDKLFLRHGYKAVMLAGGSTSLIGDPGGKDKERPLQSEETIAANIKGAQAQIKQILRGHDIELVNNLDWTRDMRVLPFLRDIGKYFSMTPLVQRDYIANRIGEGGAGISYTEFSYTILQGMDYLHLFDTKGVTLQFGGSDQWGNCISGVDLIRKARNAEVDVVTHNLIINKSTGKKFGKSEEGAVWLDPGLTSPTQFYQFWINADDAGVEEYLKIFTELDKDRVDQILSEHQADPGARHAQVELARAVTTIVHGEDQMRQAELVTQFLTGAKPVAEADEVSLAVIRQELPAVSVAEDASILQALIDGKLADSISDARRLLKGNAISIDGTKVARENFEPADFHGGRLLLKKGKKFRDSILVELAK